MHNSVDILARQLGGSLVAQITCLQRASNYSSQRAASGQRRGHQRKILLCCKTLDRGQSLFWTLVILNLEGTKQHLQDWFEVSTRFALSNHSNMQFLLCHKKSGSIFLLLHFSNMTNWICLRPLAVFLTTWLQSFLRTFGFSEFFCVVHTAWAPEGHEVQSQVARRPSS